MISLELRIHESPKAQSHETNSDVGFDGRPPRLGASCFRSSPHAALAILSGSHASILVPSMGRD